MSIEEDFVLTSNKKGGGRRKQTDKKNTQKKNTCYSAKHIRKVEERYKTYKNKNLI